MNIEKTYCNPTPLPDYPIGRSCFYRDKEITFRETADPSVIYEDGKWYLYSSCGMAYWTEDFIHWNHEKLEETYDVGYAPTIVKHNGKFYMTACSAGLYVSDSPLGPFEILGQFITPEGDVYLCDDPMLFSDDDGRLYLYSGCGGGIKGVELDANNPCQLLTEPQVMFDMDPENHVWERMGDWNQDGTYSWVEGAWMYKRNGIYYLTYCGPGTEWTSYAMGAYKGPSPMGPWEYMETTPFMSNKHGLVRGPGHGCIVDGPNGTTWAFYTCIVCYACEFERRIGYDPIGFDENGNIIPTSSTENPQWAPGVVDEPYKGNAVGIVPLTQHARWEASSNAPGRDGIYAIDDSMLSWWQPAADDEAPSLTVKLSEEELYIYSMRIMWRDVGISMKRSDKEGEYNIVDVGPGPFKYTVEARAKDGEWITVLDESTNDKDMLIDYKPIKEMYAHEVKLNIVGKPEGVEPGVINFTVFGSWKKLD